jgi:hypothetical protein
VSPLIETAYSLRISGRALLAGLCALLCWCRPAWPQDLKFTFVDQTAADHPRAVLTISELPNYTEVTFITTLGDKEITRFRDDTHILTATYLDDQGHETARTFYAYPQRVVDIHGEIQAQYPYAFPTFENNGSLFYIFSHFSPAPGETLTFKLIQSNFSRVKDPFQRWLIARLVGPIPMALKYLARETITVGTQQVEAEKYELGINDSVMALFWPHKYYFWYSVSDHTALRYTGSASDNREHVFQLTASEALGTAAPDTSRSE